MVEELREGLGVVGSHGDEQCIDEFLGCSHGDQPFASLKRRPYSKGSKYM